MSVSLEVQKREVRPRSLRNKLRHTGKIPAILNGYNVESIPVAINAKELEKILRENGINTLLTFNLDSQKINALVSQLTTDTFTKQITHAEILSVNMTEETQVEAEIALVGKADGVVNQTLYNATVSAIPAKLPERIEVSIAGLTIGQTLTVADLPKSADYTIINEPTEQVVSIAEAQAVPLDDTVTDETAAEPAIVDQRGGEEA